MQISYEPYELIDDENTICPRCNEQVKLLCPHNPNPHYGLPAFYVCRHGHIGQVGVGQIIPPNIACRRTKAGRVPRRKSNCQNNFYGCLVVGCAKPAFAANASPLCRLLAQGEP